MSEVVERKMETPALAACRIIASPAMQKQISEALPAHVTLEKFTRVVLTAVQQNPRLTEKRESLASLYQACTKCASDGLLPDGREAALVPFNTKVDGRWVTQVQYMPMIGGITKRLAMAGITVEAHVVYENDVFEQEFGDTPRLVHRPPKLGNPRGQPIGAYSIAHLPDGTLKREVMDVEQIEEVRAASRAKDGGPWTQWWGEMARKTVTRRNVKGIGLTDPEVEKLLKHDDETFEFGDRERQFDQDQNAAPVHSSLKQRMGIETPKDDSPPVYDEFEEYAHAVSTEAVVETLDEDIPI